MKILDIYGDNRFEKYTKTREVCRGIVVSDEKFSKHQDYANVNEMKRGAYLREYEALSNFIEIM